MWHYIKEHKPTAVWFIITAACLRYLNFPNTLYFLGWGLLSGWGTPSLWRVSFMTLWLMRRGSTWTASKCFLIASYVNDVKIPIVYFSKIFTSWYLIFLDSSILFMQWIVTGVKVIIIRCHWFEKIWICWNCSDEFWKISHLHCSKPRWHFTIDLSLWCLLVALYNIMYLYAISLEIWRFLHCLVSFFMVFLLASRTFPALRVNSFKPPPPHQTFTSWGIL